MERVSIRETTVEFVQQWWCVSCRHSFTFRRSDTRQHFSDVFIKEAVKDFIQGRSSYAVIKQRKDVSLGTLSSWVHQFGNTCMSPVEIAHSLNLHQVNKWSGILLLDGKYLNKRSVLLLAIDYQTLDIVAHLVAEAETEENYIKLLDLVEGTGYSIKAVISDGEPSILALTQPKKPTFTRKGTRTYPRPGIPPAKTKLPPLLGIPHQWCSVHAERELRGYLVKAARLTHMREAEFENIQNLIKNILFAQTLRLARKAYQSLLEKVVNTHSRVYQQIPKMISARWNLLTTHYTVRVGKRKIPRSTNAIENVISYLNTRLKTMRKLRTASSAVPICNLIVINFRCKPLINTQNKLKRGKSPLALSVGKNIKFDWITFIKKSCS